MAFSYAPSPMCLQDDVVWAETLRKLGFRPTSHTIYLRGAWVTDLRPYGR